VGVGSLALVKSFGVMFMSWWWRCQPVETEKKKLKFYRIPMKVKCANRGRKNEGNSRHPLHTTRPGKNTRFRGFTLMRTAQEKQWRRVNHPAQHDKIVKKEKQFKIFRHRCVKKVSMKRKFWERKIEIENS